MKVVFVSVFIDIYIVFVVQRNYDPTLHPLEAPREYARALNAAKLDRVFAQPFLGAMEGHKDGIQAMVNYPNKLSIVVSGCCDGEVSISGLNIRHVKRGVERAGLGVGNVIHTAHFLASYPPLMEPVFEVFLHSRK